MPNEKALHQERLFALRHLISPISSSMTDSLEPLLDRLATIRDGVVCGRYAPSPTGDLHLGNLRTALVAWLQARLMNGVFVIRMEDLDRPRNKPGCGEKMLRDLERLGLDWDEGPDVSGPLGPYSQLERDHVYKAALARLQSANRVFPCFCSRKDIREAASAPHGASVVYPGTCRKADIGRAQPPDDNTPAWRFAVDPRVIGFHDCLRGMYRQRLDRDVGDFVVKRRDDLFAYQLAVVVDDALMGVTDVVRGDDLLDSTPRQIALQEALGLPTPRYWHVPVMRDTDGRRLSKRHGALSLDEYIEAGGTMEALIGRFAADLSLTDSDDAVSARELLSGLEPTDLLRIQAPGEAEYGHVPDPAC